ncbi:Cryptochrome-like protein cry2 [Tepidimonas sediminis]|uniref:Cryptochrome-like protein cry2 n=1 Tax=Tepidimonas sediminis TaxID=2588941 RepID=A0A554WS62_9BURK|nr:FAD-binding domain-containing protein [Tepidimonas sediminis]TSE26417.1 Cryptochrome-like protein cry2 [Tepidimonas sediminis]
MSGVQLVWFKRDLRVRDHAPLVQAAARGPVLALYIVEPGLWRQPDAAAQHWGFIRESLLELDAALRATGRPHAALHVAVGDAVAVLAALHRRMGLAAIHAHEETGNGWTSARDSAVRRWARAHGVALHEVAAFGVVRGLRDRDRWLAARERLMRAPQAPWPPPRLAFAPWPWAVRSAIAPLAWWLGEDGEPRAGPWPDAAALGLDPWEPPQRQRGGRTRAEATLHGFLQRRAVRYRGGISSPLSAPGACSRLSPYLAYGVLSLREVVQATEARLQALADCRGPGHAEAARLRAGLRAFASRLYWHCHFIQKLESEPELEWRNLHRGYDGLREAEWDEARWAALREGRTGWPMVDACVAMLRAHGWLNFRMRAMLVSVAAYPLWLHWREVGLWLARLFLDYEPGIHWPQVQMQSGTTGINATRVYNPVKQALDHDPHGTFVRAWCPVLRRVPDAWLFEPWRMPAGVQQACGVRVGADWPQPPVELEAALRTAKARLHAWRQRPEMRAEAQAVAQRHGSRRGMPGALARDPATGLERRFSATGTLRRAAARAAPPAVPEQLGFDW